VPGCWDGAGEGRHGTPEPGEQTTAVQPREPRGAAAEVTLPWLSPCCSPVCLGLPRGKPASFWARLRTPVALQF